MEETKYDRGRSELQQRAVAIAAWERVRMKRMQRTWVLGMILVAALSASADTVITRDGASYSGRFVGAILPDLKARTYTPVILFCIQVGGCNHKILVY